MRIFLFLILSFLFWGCSTVEVTKEVIKVKNTITEKDKESASNENNENNKIKEIVDEKEFKQEIEIIEEKQAKEKNIVESQQNNNVIPPSKVDSLAAHGIRTENPQQIERISCGYLNHLFADGYKKMKGSDSEAS